MFGCNSVDNIHEIFHGKGILARIFLPLT